MQRKSRLAVVLDQILCIEGRPTSYILQINHFEGGINVMKISMLLVMFSFSFNIVSTQLCHGSKSLFEKVIALNSLSCTRHWVD